VHVGERVVQPDAEREALFGFDPVDDGGLQIEIVFDRQARERFAARQGVAERVAQLPQLVEGRSAVVAPLEVGADVDLIAERQFFVVVGVEAATGGGAGEHLHADLASRSSCRRA
jgi:hypothetical protein